MNDDLTLTFDGTTLAVCWPVGGLVPPDQIAAAQNAVLESLQQASEADLADARRRPEVARLGALRRRLDEARRLSAEAAAEAGAAQGRARDALAGLDDPAPHEAAERDALARQASYDARVPVLLDLVRAAHADATRAVHDVCGYDQVIECYTVRPNAHGNAERVPHYKRVPAQDGPRGRAIKAELDEVKPAALAELRAAVAAALAGCAATLAPILARVLGVSARHVWQGHAGGLARAVLGDSPEASPPAPAVYVPPDEPEPDPDPDPPPAPSFTTILVPPADDAAESAFLSPPVPAGGDVTERDTPVPAGLPVGVDAGEASLVRQFLADCCDLAGDREVESQALFASWAAWASARGVGPGDHGWFGKVLHAVAVLQVYQPRRPGGARPRVLIGVGLKQVVAAPAG